MYDKNLWKQVKKLLEDANISLKNITNIEIDNDLPPYHIAPAGKTLCMTNLMYMKIKKQIPVHVEVIYPRTGDSKLVIMG